jgi:hypothetical protein
MRYSHTPIFQATYILTLAIYKATGNFKKEYKYTLGEQLKLLCHNLLDLIVLANITQEKALELEKLNIKLETLRIHLRLAFDLKAVSAGLLGELNRQIEEIGKQIGGWQKWAAKTVSPPAPAGVSRAQGPGESAAEGNFRPFP